VNNISICWIDNGDILGGAELFSIDMIYGLIRFAQENPETQFNLDIFSQSVNTSNSFARKIQIAIKTLTSENKNISVTHQSLFIPALKPFSFTTVKKFIQSIVALKNIINTKKYNVVYCNTVRSALITGVAQFFFPKNTKTIYMAHDYTFPHFLGKFIIPRFSQILACSYAIKTYLLEMGIKPWKAEVIQNGVDINFLKEIPPVEAPLFEIGIIGRLAEWKGQMTVLQAALWLKENAKEFPFTFTFYGETSNKIEDMKFERDLHKFVKDNNLEDIVTFAGFTSLQIALKNSKIIIHASTEEEPFGRTPIEAAGSKRVACISNIGTPSKIFTDKENAFFFEAGNHESLAHTLAIIAHNKNTSLQIAENGQKLVQEKFNVEKISKLFWGIVTNLN